MDTEPVLLRVLAGGDSVPTDIPVCSIRSSVGSICEKANKDVQRPAVGSGIIFNGDGFIFRAFPSLTKSQ